MQRLDWLLGSVTDIVTFIGGAAIVAMMLQVFLDVVTKYLFGMPVPATLELVSYYYMAATVFLPMAALERKGNLIYVELFYEHLGKRMQHGLHAVALILGTIYCGFVAYAAWEPAMQSYQAGSYAGSLTRILIWPTRFLPIVGFGLLAFVMILKLISLFDLRRFSAEPPSAKN